MIFTNSPKDTIRAAFEQYTQKPCSVLLACPFFSNASLIKEMLNRNCSVRLIVRLSAATSPDGLSEIFQRHVPIRYFTSSRFHSKLYVFGDEVALVGSANLTDAGVQSNQEVCVAIDSEDPRYERLVQVFQSYWDNAAPLDEQTLRNFKIIKQQNKISNEAEVDEKIRHAFGDIAPLGIKVGDRQSAEQVYLSDYKRGYQEFLSAYRQVETIYNGFNDRKIVEKILPLRIEIDQLFNFIREKYAPGENYADTPLLYDPELTQNLKHYIQLWLVQPWSYLEKEIVENYSRIVKVLGSRETINAAEFGDLLDALTVCHAFHDTRRFHKGGLNGLRTDFMRDNDLDRVRRTLTYLLFGPGDFIDRMGNCIFNEEYSLRWFGRSCVQEVLGWVNGQNIPICNGRTVKAMRYLGFDVKIFS